MKFPIRRHEISKNPGMHEQFGERVKCTVEIGSVKRATPDHLSALGRMADSVYRPQKTWGEGMPREFPHLFCAGNAANLFYIEDRGHPVSMVGVLKQTGIIPGAAIPIASVGSVATLPEYRGRHLATQILQEAFAVMSEENMALCLISGSRDLYLRQGAVPVGCMETVEVDLRQPLPQMRNSVHKVAAEKRREQAEFLIGLYQSQPYRFLRTRPQMQELLNALWFQRSHYNQELFVIGPEQRPLAYLVIYAAQPASQRGVVVEWAGDRVAVAQALPYVMTQMKVQRLTMRVHAQDTEMRHIIQESGWNAVASPLQGTARVLNAAVLKSVLAPLITERSALLPEIDRTDSTALLHALFAPPESGGAGIHLMLTDDLNYI
jgi:GNAT superfamily N-acetyltransferase